MVPTPPPPSSPPCCQTCQGPGRLTRLRSKSTPQSLPSPVATQNNVKQSLSLAMTAERYPQEAWIRVYTYGSATNAMANGVAGIFSLEIRRQYIVRAVVESTALTDTHKQKPPYSHSHCSVFILLLKACCILLRHCLC